MIGAPSPSRQDLSFVSVFLLLDTAVQIAFKLAGRELGDGALNAAWLIAALRSPTVWCAILLYLAVFVLWMQILQRVDLARAFPLTALTYVTVLTAGLLFFHETVEWTQATATALIVAGVVLVGQTD